MTRDYTNAAGQVIAEDAYFNLGGLAYSTGVMGTVNVNYYQTQYGYDSDGRLVRTQTPNGTIYRTVYNSLGEEISDWVGTNDTPTTGEWSPTNNTGTSNMVEVSALPVRQRRRRRRQPDAGDGLSRSGRGQRG